MKSFSTVRDTQRGSQSYMEKRRGRKEDRGDQDEMRWNQKRREQASQSSLPNVLSTIWTAQRCSRSYTQKRRGRKETEVARRIKWESKGERQIQPVISSLSVLHRPAHTKMFTELGREKKGERGDRGDWWRKRRVQRGREQSSQ